MGVYNKSNFQPGEQGYLDYAKSKGKKLMMLNADGEWVEVTDMDAVSNADLFDHGEGYQGNMMWVDDDGKPIDQLVDTNGNIPNMAGFNYSVFGNGAGGVDGLTAGQARRWQFRQDLNDDTSDLSMKISNGNQAMSSFNTMMSGYNSAKNSDVTNGVMQGLSAVGQGLEKAGGWGKFANGAIQANNMAANINQAVGLTSDQQTVADQIADATLFGGLFDALESKTKDFNVNEKTKAMIGGSWNGTFNNLDHLSTRAGKKFSLISGGVRSHYDNLLDKAKETMSRLDAISKTVEDQNDSVRMLSDDYSKAYGFDLSGGYKQQYTRVSEKGGKIEKKPDKPDKMAPEPECVVKETVFPGGKSVVIERMVTMPPRYIGNNMLFEHNAELADEAEGLIKSLIGNFLSGKDALVNIPGFGEEKDIDPEAVMEVMNGVSAPFFDSAPRVVVVPPCPPKCPPPCPAPPYRAERPCPPDVPVPPVRYDESMIDNPDVIEITTTTTTVKKRPRGGPCGAPRPHPPMMRSGGSVEKQLDAPETEESGQKNLIPEGALHKSRHHMENADDYTKKGIPVVDDNLEQQAEIEKNEIIFNKEVTDKMEELYTLYYSPEASDEEKDAAAIECGKLLTREIMLNTDDRTGLIKELKRGGRLQDGGKVYKGRSLDELVRYAEEVNPRFIQRLNEFPKILTFETGNGKEHGSHLLSYTTDDDENPTKAWVFPAIMEDESGRLVLYDDPRLAEERGDELEMTPDEAEYFTSHYKEHYNDYMKQFNEMDKFLNAHPEMDDMDVYEFFRKAYE